MSTTQTAMSVHLQRIASYQERETDQDKCLRIAARHGVRPGNARKCFEGSEGCPTCPWKGGWSDALRATDAARTNAPQPSSSRALRA